MADDRLYSKSKSGWVAVRKGSESKFESMSAADAKARWPSYADEIERAVKAVGGRNSIRILPNYEIT